LRYIAPRQSGDQVKIKFLGALAHGDHALADCIGLGNGILRYRGWSFVLDERRVLPAYNIGIASRRRCSDEHLRGLDEPCALFPGLIGGGCWLTVLASLCTFITVRRVGSDGLAGRQSLAVAAIVGRGSRRLGNVFALAAVGLACECSEL